MTLHPQAQALLQYMESRGIPPVESLPLHIARESFVQTSQQINKSEPVAEVVDKEIPGYKRDVAIRVYTPDGEGPFPALVYFHGGGFVLGNLDSHDALCRSFANQAGCKVISVDYSLAPEEKFPVPVEDALLSVKWVFENAAALDVDADRIAVGGDSAGGNLATVACYLAKQRNLSSPVFQLLIYPSTGFNQTESSEAFSKGYYLTGSMMKWFTESYLRSLEDVKNPLAAPLEIDDLSVMPQALVVTAEYDPLRDNGEAYAAKMKQAGVEVECIRYEGMIHGFVSMTEPLEDGKKAIADMSQRLKQVFVQTEKHV